MTDVELDARVTALEENGVGGNTQNGNKMKLLLFHGFLNCKKRILYFREQALLNHVCKISDYLCF